MSIQSMFTAFHKNIKVENDELREKRDIIFDKIRNSLKNASHPLPTLLNQGSYIYGVGIKPLGETEYDIDIGLEFDIRSCDYKAAEVRKWVYDAIAEHTKKVEDRGPCIRVRYAAGYHVDLVIYAMHKDNDQIEEYQMAYKDGTWKPSEPKKLKEYINRKRENFSNSKDSSGSDQLQRVTRYLKRWNDIDIPGDSDDKPFGLATLLLVINKIVIPVYDKDNCPDDVTALVNIAKSIEYCVGRIQIHKPTQQYEDVFGKLSENAMERLKKRFTDLRKDLETAIAKNDEEESSKIMHTVFGDDFPEMKTSQNDEVEKQRKLADMNAAISNFSFPPKPWSND